MEIDFTGQTVVVTGVARGIGSAITHAFAHRGATVHAVDIEADQLTAVASDADCRNSGQVITHVVDMTDAAAVNEFVHSIGAVNIGVHAAGGIRSRQKMPIESVTDEDWRVIQAVNVDGAFHLARALVPAMKRQKKGRIILISSRAGLGVSLTGIQSYGTAKAAQIGLVRQLAAELGPHGITVNSVAPGFMPTSPDYIKQWESYGAEGQKKLVESIAMRRVGKPDDIAHAVLFLSSDYAEWITGQTLPVTGSP